MDLFTEADKQQLLLNGQPENYDKDNAPVVKLTLPWTGCIWLLSEIDPENQDIAFGLCDLGIGSPELGSISLTELQSICYMEGMPVQQNTSFEASYPMSVYAEAARAEGAITDDHVALRNAAERLRPAIGPSGIFRLTR